MQRITAVDPKFAGPRAKPLLDAVQDALGMTPNMTRTMVQSPAVLNAYLALSGALAQASLGGKVGAQIALVTAEENGCGYCAAAHTVFGKGAGLSASEIDDARDGRASEPRAQAALVLARAILEARGRISDVQFAAARAGGLSEGEIGEVVAHVALNVFTNYFNGVAATEVDFPAVRAPSASARTRQQIAQSA